MSFVSTLLLCAPWLALAPLVAQAPSAVRELPTTAVASRGKVDPWLHAALADATPGASVAVYFALADRIGEERWFPRVRKLPLPQRRRFVVDELRDHAARAQRELLDLLAVAAQRGECDSIRSNWLGNFVQCEASPATIAAALELPSVAYARLDVAPRLQDVADGTAAEATRVHAAPPSTNPAPGDGPAQTKAFVAWAYGFRGQGVVIANVDGGLSQHSDLDLRRWTNVAEIPGNGVDDDQNGFVDDVHGFAFDLGNAQLDDGGGHGTKTAGLLVADGSCGGIAWGQAPAAHVMTCRTLSETSQWNAVQYALAMGADVQTSSFSYKADFVPPPDYRMHRDIATASLAAGLIRVNSAGNEAAFAADPTSALRVPCNVAAPACVPSPYRDPAQAAGGRSGVIAVGAWRAATQTIDPVSPYGPFAWSLADLRQNVPGYPAAQWDAQAHEDYPWQQGASAGLLKPDVLGPTGTTTTGGGPCRTQLFSGTSNAAPCVAGVIALWKCANPSLTPEDAAMIVHQTASDLGNVPGMENRYGAGLVDAERGLRRALCVHRVDFEPAWSVTHDIASGPVSLAIDGVPTSLAVVAVGPQRMPLAIGSLQLGIGPVVEVVFGGVTDAHGDLSAQAGVGPWLVGLTAATQAVLLDQTHTGSLLESNVVEITFR